MDEIEVPEYFICPISLQIMKDPVIAITGITYDRESIEQWLFTNHNNTTCPVTKQPLPIDSDLTPNHTLHRLIQAWCTQNSSLVNDTIPTTPKSPLHKIQVLKILKNLNDPKLKLKSLRQLLELLEENEMNKKCLVEAGVPKAMIMFIVSCYRKGQNQIDEGIEEALSLLKFLKVPTEEEVRVLIEKNDDILDSLTWVLGFDMENSVFVIKNFIQKCDSSVLERLKPEFFEEIVKVLRHGKRKTQQQHMLMLCSALKILLCACPYGRNRVMMVEAGAVFELIEIEMGALPTEKRITELNLATLFHLCSCANGRAQFLSHKGSIAVLTERMLKVSVAVDDRVVFTLSLIAKFSCTKIVMQEMLKVGTVSKLFMLIQLVDHAKYIKEKAMEILKCHSEVWKDSPCFPDRSSFYMQMQTLHK